MTHPTPAEQPQDGAAVQERLDAIQLRYEKAKASIVGLGRPAESSPAWGDAPMPETEAIDLRRLPPVPPLVAEDDVSPAAIFHGNVAAEVPGRRPWWRRVRLQDGGAGRR